MHNKKILEKNDYHRNSKPAFQIWCVNLLQRQMTKLNSIRF